MERHAGSPAREGPQGVEAWADAEDDAQHGSNGELQARQTALESRAVAPALVSVLQHEMPRDETPHLLGVRSLGGDKEEVDGGDPEEGNLPGARESPG